MSSLYSARSSTPEKSCYSTSSYRISRRRETDCVASGYLESLCDYLYDDLRPRILHEPRLTALCEVCTVLQALMVLDVPSLPDSSSDDDAELDELVLDLDQPRRQKGLRSLHISHLLQMVLQDAQTRLCFKTQSVSQTEIRYYVPKPEDLAYPDKLVDEFPRRIICYWPLPSARRLTPYILRRGSLSELWISRRSRASARSFSSNPLTSRRRGILRSKRQYGYSHSSKTSSRCATVQASRHSPLSGGFSRLFSMTSPKKLSTAADKPWLVRPRR